MAIRSSRHSLPPTLAARDPESQEVEVLGGVSVRPNGELASGSDGAASELAKRPRRMGLALTL